MARKLLPREEIFVWEYVLDWDHRRAALAAGYPNANWGAKVIKKYAVQQVIAEQKQARKERLRVDGDKLTEEYAKVAFANSRDYVPRRGKVLDIHRLDADRTAAIERVEMTEVTDRITGETTRKLNVKLYDKVGALNSLAKSIGMLTERHVIEGTVEHIIGRMTPEERLERVEQLRNKARVVYLPQYREMRKVVDVTPERVTVRGNNIGVGDGGDDGDDVNEGEGASDDVNEGEVEGADNR